MIAAIGAGLLLVFLAGFGIKLMAMGEANGRAACIAELKVADDRLVAAANELEQEAANHITDMEAAFEVGEAKAKTRTVYVQTKGAADVAKYPVFSNPVCVLPADSLLLLNRTRASLRSTADTVATDGAVRGAVPAAKGNAGGDVPADVAGRRPMGKVRPQP